MMYYLKRVLPTILKVKYNFYRYIFNNILWYKNMNLRLFVNFKRDKGKYLNVSWNTTNLWYIKLYFNYYKFNGGVQNWVKIRSA